MEMMIGEKWSRVEIYNEYLKKISSLLAQISTVEKMQLKAHLELIMLEGQPEDDSHAQYQARLLSTLEQCQQRLAAMKEELRLIQRLKQQMESELDFLQVK